MRMAWIQCRCVFRLFGPGQAFGRGFGAIATLSAFAFRGEPVRIFGDGETVRDYIFVTDAVEALLRAGRSSATSRVLKIGTGEGHSLNDIVNIVARYVDYPLKINHEARRSFDIPISVLKIDRARKEPGWAPIVPFDEGVAEAILDVKVPTIASGVGEARLSGVRRKRRWRAHFACGHG
jgi:UDP-glucose 4-epimerase